ncbi:nanos homolog 1 [Nothoprocta perdicaria]|uniref:Nanos C2HC-type zinc finger 1 n=1 Tax=Nothoprocta perdicaria TaxID=30464 RepID=A0A8C7EH61_NOTPE|nr:nanos homolog 1 [Nothoprocta perdicaria]
METFPAVELEPPPPQRHLPPGQRLPGGRYGARSARGNVFNSWNDYLGLATLITKAVAPGAGPRPAALEDDEELEEEEEEDEEEEAAGRLLEGALDLRALQLCGRPERGGAWGGLVVSAGRPPALGGGAGGGARLRKAGLPGCVFCRNTREAGALPGAHSLRGADGRVLCPVLRRYTCPLCGASGDYAHTVKYCPRAPRRRPR